MSRYEIHPTHVDRMYSDDISYLQEQFHRPPETRAIPEGTLPQPTDQVAPIQETVVIAAQVSCLLLQRDVIDFDAIWYAAMIGNYSM